MTAENFEFPGRGGRPGNASMRPRPMTAENVRPAFDNEEALNASMRPRPMTAENVRERDTFGDDLLLQ